MRAGLLLVAVVCARAASAAEEVQDDAGEVKSSSTVRGHLGIVAPLVSASSAGVSTIASGLTFGVTSGVGIGIAGPLRFDVELVALIDTANRVVNIVVHPGLLVSLPFGFTTGLRGGWETAGAAGVTPLINKAFEVATKVLYVEAAFPIRWSMQTPSLIPSVTFALHIGIGF